MPSGITVKHYSNAASIGAYNLLPAPLVAKAETDGTQFNEYETKTWGELFLSELAKQGLDLTRSRYTLTADSLVPTTGHFRSGYQTYQGHSIDRKTCIVRLLLASKENQGEYGSFPASLTCRGRGTLYLPSDGSGDDKAAGESLLHTTAVETPKAFLDGTDAAGRPHFGHHRIEFPSIMDVHLRLRAEEVEFANGERCDITPPYDAELKEEDHDKCFVKEGSLTFTVSFK